MCRCVLPVASLIGLLVFTALAVPALGGREDQGPVYSVAALNTRLARDPEAWAGKIVRIRAIAEPCPAWGSPHSPLHCTTIRPDLVDLNGPDLSEPLLLVVSPEDRLLTLIHQVPILSRIVPPVPAPRWEDLRTYRVRLRAAPAGSCSSPPCYEAVLVDATP